MGSALLFTAYITVHALGNNLSDSDWQGVLAPLREQGVQSVVLEAYRGGATQDEPTLRAMRDRFRAEGFQTLGGLMPVWGAGDFGTQGQGIEMRLPFFCYSSEKTVADLEAEIRKLARLFDRVVIDDAFLTSCRCDACNAARGQETWPGFRRDLLCRVAERWVRAAHEENPSVALIDKFPQYYDRLHLFGYDAERFPGIFDGVWIGTETRNPETPKFGYTEPYQGYFNAMWMRACAGEKFQGAWFDALDCDARLFRDQAISTSLAGPPRITLFNYGDKLFNVLPPVAAMKPTLDTLAGLAQAAQGVYVVKPPNSDGAHDLFIYDYLGMMGIPCLPAVRLESNMRSVIVPAQGLDAPGAPEAIAAVLDAGGQVILTHGALMRLTDRPEVLRRFGYAPGNISTNRAEATGFEVAGERIASSADFRPAGDLEPDPDVQVPAWALFGSWSGDRRVPLVSVKGQSNGGRAVVWNLSTFGHDAYTIEEHLCVPVRTGLLTLPEPVIGMLRRTATEPLGFTVEAPARVATFLSSDRMAFVNYGQSPVDVRVEGLVVDPATLQSDPPGASAQPNALHLPANTVVIAARKPAGE